MKITAVTMVKDEVDIIEYTLAYMAPQVDEIIVADNLSSDGTLDLVHSLVDSLPCDLYTKIDNEVGYYQSRKMTQLAHLAADRGADWVVPFDADEVWSGDVRPLREQLERVTDACPVAAFRLFNYFPCTGDDFEARNPFQRIYHRDKAPAALPKVAVRPWPNLMIEQGNHGATVDGRRTSGPMSGVVRHFPWRSFDQFERKVRNGAAAYLATDLPEDMGAHWRGYGRILQELGPEGLREGVWDKWFFDPPVDLVRDPIDPPFWA